MTVCSFCHKSKEETNKLVKGQDDVYICDHCVDLCHKVLSDEHEEKKRKKRKKGIPYPHEIYNDLNKWVIGQESAKRALSVAAHNHYKRLSRGDLIQKSNLLMLGPTGVGKTLLARTLAKILDVPFAICDATTLTEAGYVGEDVENILVSLYQNADNNSELTERGIIYIDEIDKISKKQDSANLTRDVSGEGVQQALLKIVEGTIASIPPPGGRKHPGQDFVKINTENILFIAGGAFVGLEDYIQKRMDKNISGIGFNSTLRDVSEKRVGEILQNVEANDLKTFGLIPEFIGRFPIVVSLNDLTLEDMKHVITDPKDNLIDQYKELFKMDGIELTFDDDALEEICVICMDKEIGARGLRSTLETVLADLQFEVGLLKEEFVYKVLITKDTVLGGPPMKFYEKRVLDNFRE